MRETKILEASKAPRPLPPMPLYNLSARELEHRNRDGLRDVSMVKTTGGDELHPCWCEYGPGLAGSGFEEGYMDGGTWGPAA